MKKIIYLFKEIIYLILKHRVYFLAPLLIMLGILAFLVWQLGPTVIVTFIYAGV